MARDYLGGHACIVAVPTKKTEKETNNPGMGYICRNGSWAIGTARPEKRQKQRKGKDETEVSQLDK